MHMAAKVPVDLVRQVDAFAEREGRSRSWAIRELIERSIRRLRMPTTVRDAKGREMTT